MTIEKSTFGEEQKSPISDPTLLVREAFRLAEVNLQSEMSIALAADQRALAFCSLLIAAIAIVVGTGGMANFGPSQGFALLFLTLAAIFAAFSARSAKIVVPGMLFEAFERDLSSNRSVEETLTELGSHYNESSVSNRKLIARNARVFNGSLFAALCGLVLLIWPAVKLLLQLFQGESP